MRLGVTLAAVLSGLAAPVAQAADGPGGAYVASGCGIVWGKGPYDEQEREWAEWQARITGHRGVSCVTARRLLKSCGNSRKPPRNWRVSGRLKGTMVLRHDWRWIAFRGYAGAAPGCASGLRH